MCLKVSGKLASGSRGRGEDFRMESRRLHFSPVISQSWWSLDRFPLTAGTDLVGRISRAVPSEQDRLILLPHYCSLQQCSSQGNQKAAESLRVHRGWLSLRLCAQ